MPDAAADASVAHDHTDRTGWLLAVACVAMFSIATPMSKWAIVSGVDPVALLPVRMWIGSALIAGWLLLTAPQRLRMKPRHAALAFLAGASNGVGMLGYFYALTRIDGSIATMIFATSPLCTLGLLALRGERVTRLSMARIALGLLGVWLIVGPNGRVDLWGAAGVLLSAITFAWQLAILQWNLSEADGAATTLMIVVGMASVGTVAFLGVHGLVWQPIGAVGWVTCIVLAIISTWLSRLALFAAVKRIGSGQVSMVLPIETPLAVTWSVLFRGERLNALEVAGGVLILSSALLRVRKSA